MIFLNPSFLWAFAALSIPVLIHLFNFRKTVRVYFSNNRFLRQAQEVRTSRRKLKHYLILASRILFLSFLILAFAQPFIPAQGNLGAFRNVVLYIDNSQSMSAQMDDGTRGLDAAIGIAQEIIGLFPPDTRYRILTNDFAPFSNTYKTKAEALDWLTQIRLSPVTRSMEEIKARMVQGGGRSTEHFWISDFQKSTLGKIPSRWDSTGRWHMVPISFSPAPNIFIDSAFLENPFAAGGEKNALMLRVRNDGKREVDQLGIRLSINGVQAGTTSVSIPAGGVTETKFDLTTGLFGLNRAVVTFNDHPVSFDNEFFVALNFTDRISILEIKPGGESTPVEKVFGNKQIFSIKSVSAGNFNYSLLNQADLVVVNGLNSIDASLGRALQDFLAHSGTLLLIPGPSPDVSSFAPITGPVQLRTTALKESPEKLDPPDFNNPFFENVFEERSLSITMPGAIPLVEWGADRSAILRFKNDKPFLSSFDFREGRIFLLASPLLQSFTDFCNHALFVPVMYRIAASSRKNESRLYHTLDENFITLRIDSLQQDEPVRMTGEQEIVPPQRIVNDQVFLEVPRFTVSQGFYNIVAKQDTLGLVAFNLHKAESLLEQYSAAELMEQWKGNEAVGIFEADSAEAFSNEIKARYLGTPLWKYAVLLSLLFLLAEITMIRFLK